MLRRYSASISLGASQVCCWVTRAQKNDSHVLMGWGHVGTRGLWGGQLTDVLALQESLVEVLYAAEQRSGIVVRQAQVVLNNGFFSGQLVTLDQAILGSAVTDQDVQALYARVSHPQARAVHITPLDFRVDHQGGLHDPRGFVGKNLQGQFHVLWMDEGVWQTLHSCFRRCHLDRATIVAAPYAQVASCVLSDERQLGVAVLDIGASCTSLSIVFKGHMLGCTTVPLGAHTITQDIARGCDTPLAYAERIKILHGAALTLSHDRHETIPLMAMDERDPAHVSEVSRAFLSTIIQARAQEILAKVKQNLDRVPAHHLIQRVVLTGGGSQLAGMRELAQRVLGRSVRLAHNPVMPLTARLTKSGSGPMPIWENAEFTSVYGGLLHQSSPLEDKMHVIHKMMSIFSWFRKKM